MKQQAAAAATSGTSATYAGVPRPAGYCARWAHPNDSDPVSTRNTVSHDAVSDDTVHTRDTQTLCSESDHTRP